MEDRLPKKLVAILHTDVAGCRHLVGEDENATHGRIKESLNLSEKKLYPVGGRPADARHHFDLKGASWFLVL